MKNLTCALVLFLLMPCIWGMAYTPMDEVTSHAWTQVPSITIEQDSGGYITVSAGHCMDLSCVNESGDNLTILHCVHLGNGKIELFIEAHTGNPVGDL